MNYSPSMFLFIYILAQCQIQNCEIEKIATMICLVIYLAKINSNALANYVTFIKIHYHDDYYQYNTKSPHA